MWKFISFFSLISSLCSLLDSANGNTPDRYWNISDRTNCSLIPRNPALPGQIQALLDEGSRMIIFDITITGALGPLSGNYPGGLFDVKTWTLITEEAGEAMLLFPDDYVAKSLYTLSFRRHFVDLLLDQLPQNCFNGSFTLDQVVNTIRLYVLRNFSDYDDVAPDNFEVCNRQIFMEDDNKTATLEYVCCNDPEKTCKILKEGPWTKTLNICLFILKFTVPFICPFFVPKRMLKSVSNFRFTLRNDDTKRISVNHIAAGSTPNDYTQTDICLSRFQEFMQKQRLGSHILELKSIVLKVRNDKLIEDGSSPVGLFQYLYKSIIQCEGNQKDSDFNGCCLQNAIYPFNCSNVSWLNCLKFITHIFMFAVLVCPWWATLIFYSVYDRPFSETVMHTETTLNIEITNLQDTQSFDSDYLAISMIFIFFVFYNMIYTDSVRFVLKTVFLYCIHGSKDRYEKSMSEFKRVLVYPFKKIGVCAVFLYPFWSVVVMLYVIKLLLQLFPLLKVFNNLFFLVFRSCTGRFQTSNISGLNIFFMVIYCLNLVYLSVFIVSECVIFYIDCLVRVIIGLLLNYDDVFKYVFLILLILAYGYECFHSVSKRYQHFYKLLSEKVQEKVSKETDNVKPTSNNEADETNIAFDIPGNADQQLNSSCFVLLPRNSLYWRAKRLVLFLDCSENTFIPFLSRQFFQEMNSKENLACPGPENLLYLKALIDFILVVAFLLFILIVVFALGWAHDLSSGMQTLVALGGGFLPFVLQKVFFKNHRIKKSNIKKNLWGKMLENEIDNFEEYWEVSDIEVKPCDLHIQEPSATSYGASFSARKSEFIVMENPSSESTIFVHNSLVACDTEIVFSGSYQSLA